MVINKSFRKVYDQLEDKNIECGFLLNYNNAELFEIDPYSPYISEIEKMMIGKECKDNLWYFLRDVVRIPMQGGLDCMSYKANLANISFLYLMEKDINVCGGVPRQLFGIMTRCLFYLWKLIKYPEYKFTVLSYKKQDAMIVLEKIKMINRLLPSYLKIDDADIDSRVNCDIELYEMDYADVKDTIELLTGDIFIMQLEYIDNITSIMAALIPKIKSGDVTISTISTVGIEGSEGKRCGDCLMMTSYKWFDELFKLELDDSFKTKMFSVYYSYKVLVDDPDEWFSAQYEFFRKVFDDDYKGIIDREILLLR